MFELLFLIAMITWAFITLIQYLAGLPAALTLLVATLAVPLLAYSRARTMARRHGLTTNRRAGPPLPPERFYWPATRHWLGWHCTLAALAAALAWPVTILWPARPAIDTASLLGWVSAMAAIIALAEAVAGLWLYVKTSQRFNRQTPTVIGWLRLGLYRISDNYEFLGEEPLPREKRVRESVY
jgi:hypothetical protein